MISMSYNTEGRSMSKKVTGSRLRTDLQVVSQIWSSINESCHNESYYTRKSNRATGSRRKKNPQIVSQIWSDMHESCHIDGYGYGVATIGRLLKITGLFCRI